MSLWLQYISVICGVVVCVLAWLRWHEKKERLEIRCVSPELRTFRIFNPTPRQIEILSSVFETWNRNKEEWIEQSEGSELPKPQSVLQPSTSYEFTLSSSQCLDFARDKVGRFRVKTGSGIENVQEIKA